MRYQARETPVPYPEFPMPQKDSQSIAEIRFFGLGRISAYIASCYSLHEQRVLGRLQNHGTYTLAVVVFTNLSLSRSSAQIINNSFGLPDNLFRIGSMLFYRFSELGLKYDYCLLVFLEVAIILF